MSRAKRCALFVIVLTMVGVCPALGAVIYVDGQLAADCTNGEYCIADRNNTGSDGNAYTTPKKAVAVVEAGDTIYIRGGTYYERTTTQSAVSVMHLTTSGTSQNPITICSYNGEEVILTAWDPDTGEDGIRKYYTVQLGMKPSSQEDVSGEGVQNVVIDGLIIEGASMAGLAIWGPANRYESAEDPTENVLIQNVIVRNNAGAIAAGGGIHTKGKLVNVIIQNCEAYNNTGTGIRFGRIDKDWHLPEPEDDMSAARFCTIRDCLSYNNESPDRPGDTDGIAGSHMYGCTIEDNVVFGNSDDGIDIYASLETTVQNNIVFDHTHEEGNCAGMKLSAGGGGRHTIAGNVLVNNHGRSLEGSYPSNPLRTFYPSRFISNLAYNGSGGIMLGGTQYDTDYPGYTKSYMRNNVLLDQATSDIYGASDGYIDSDYNFIDNASNFATMQNLGQDAHSITGDPGLVDKTVVIDTEFDSEWTLEQKLEHIRSQIRSAFRPLEGSILADAGTVVSGYHNPVPGDDGGDGRVWFGAAPDIGAVEVVLPAITDLSVSGTSRNSVTLAWTVPSEAGYTRRPTSYDIRYADNPLSETTWETATQVAGELTPGDLGAVQSFTITGLTSGATYYVAIRMGDASGNSSWLSNVVPATTATEGNHAPVMDTTGDKPVVEGATLTFSISASDADAGDTLTYDTGELPTGASFNANTRTFAWTPEAAQIGTHPVMFQVSDGDVTVSETIAITVLSGTNHAPVLASIGNKSVNENTTLSFSVSATDVDGQALTYSASGLPSGAGFVGQTFTWTPSSAQAGSYNVTFTVSDGQAQDSEAIVISVGNVNRPPVLASIGNKNVNQNANLSFSVSATDPDGDSVSYLVTGAPAGATFLNRVFSWTPGPAQSGSYSVTFTASDGTLTDSETITIVVAAVDGSDQTPPTAQNISPAAGAIQVPVNPLISLTLADTGMGVDANTVEIWVNDYKVYSGDSAVYKSDYGVCRRTGTAESYRYRYQSTDMFNCDQPVSVRVNASDLAQNAMTPATYQFTTTMHSFGGNQLVSVDQARSAHPAVATDSQGDMWAVWDAGPVGDREIILARRSSETKTWDTPVAVTASTYDCCNPAIGVAPDDSLYVVWQDNRRGIWDVYVSVSADGATWQTPARVTDSNDNHANPVVAIDGASPARAYIAWQEGGVVNADSDIYVASSTTRFASKTVARVTSDSTDQTDPALAAGPDNTVYLLWTDRRNGSADIYGSSSSATSWANVPFVTGAGDQQDPAVAVGPTGPSVHVLWTSDTAGDSDVLYGVSTGLPGSPLTGSVIADDSANADQLAPSLLAVEDHWSNAHVYASWQDHRSVADAGDTDLYFAEMKSGTAGTNILVGDDGANSNQNDPALGFDDCGQPVVFWTDDRDSTTQVYCAHSTYFSPEAQASALIERATGGLVGTVPASIAGFDDVSVTIPPLGCDSDMLVSIAPVQNPPDFGARCLAGWEIGPSGTQFAAPATITIPYPTPSTGLAVACWYDPQTGALSQDGITEVLSTTLGNGMSVMALRTTHLTTFYILEGSGSGDDGLTDSLSGGGCALGQGPGENIAGFFLPYAVLAVFVAVLRRRDRKRLRQS